MRPMKAATLEDADLPRLVFPLYVSPKLDGIRAIVNGTQVLSNSLKPIPNQFVQSELARPEYHGLDGELIIGSPFDPDAFNATTGPIRRRDGEPDFRFYVFDRWDQPHTPFKARRPFYVEGRVRSLPQVLVESLDELLAYEDKALARGYEGIMLRTPSSLYKYGRSTLNEGWLLKRKPFVDAEAVVVGIVEQQENLNEAVTNELGLAKRSSHKENKVGKGTLGTLLLQSPLWEKQIRCGRGRLPTALCQDIFDNPGKYIGQTLTFKYQSIGSIDAPRLPIALRFRDDFDC